MSYGELSNTQETMVLPMLQMKNIRGRSEILVSSKGIVNGLSNIPNDGADFGPDTTLNATAPRQYGGTYTETYGIQEAINYSNSLGSQYNGSISIYIEGGQYTVTSNIVLPPFIQIFGAGITNTRITLDSSQIIFESDTFCQKVTLSDMTVSSYNTPIDLTQSENSTHVTLRNMYISASSGTVQALIMNGNEDSLLENVGIYNNGNNTPTSTPALEWKAPNGGINMIHSYTFGATLQAIIANLQYVYIGGVLNIYNSSSGPCVYNIIGNIEYPSNLSDTSFISFLQSSTSTENISVSFKGYIGGISSAPTSIFTNNTNFITYLDISKLAIISSYSSSIPLLNSVTNIVLSPIKEQISGSITLPSTSTPSVPTSATAQENTNPYAVDVYIYGGDVTEIQITKDGTAYTVFSVSTAIAMSGQAYKLNPDDSITVTYSTAPTWEWLSD